MKGLVCVVNGEPPCVPSIKCSGFSGCNGGLGCSVDRFTVHQPEARTAGERLRANSPEYSGKILLVLQNARAPCLPRTTADMARKVLRKYIREVFTKEHATSSPHDVPIILLTDLISGDSPRAAAII